MSEKQASYIQQRCLPTYNTKLRIRCTAPSPQSRTPLPYIHSPQSQVPISCSGCLRLSRVLNFRPTKCKMVPSSRSLRAIREGGARRPSLSSRRRRRRRRATKSNFAHPSSILFIPLPHPTPSFQFPHQQGASPLSPPSLLSALPQSAAVIHIVDVKYRLTITDQVVSSSTNKRST